LQLTTTEIVHINEAAKALKQKDFIIINNIMIGLDNINNILTYTLLNSEFNTYPVKFKGLIINARALSAFIKTITLESSFEYNLMENSVIRTSSGGELVIGYDTRIESLALDRWKYKEAVDSGNISIHEMLIDDISIKIKSMNKADGSIIIKYHDYFMTVFPSILPMTKTDKLYVTIFDNGYNTFIARFRIEKKKFNIFTYINYIKL
jgi:hypothetical protein